VNKIFNRNRPIQPKFELVHLKSSELFNFLYGYESLKTLVSFDGFSERSIRNILVSCKKLETLEIENTNWGRMSFWDEPESDEEFIGTFAANKMIKNLSLKNDQLDKLHFIDSAEKLLAALPELETFFITKLSTDLMMFVAANNLKVKQVKYSSIDDRTLEKYEEMCQGDGNVNRDIKFIQI
jgi:hypothetical protein